MDYMDLEKAREERARKTAEKEANKAKNNAKKAAKAAREARQISTLPHLQRESKRSVGSESVL